LIYLVALERLLGQVHRKDGRDFAPAFTQRISDQVAWFLQEQGEAGASMYTLRTTVPELRFTWVHVALSFLADQGA
jgi:hypothetical protein